MSVDGEGGVKGDTWMGDRHVPFELENAPKSAQNMAKKYSDSARIFEKVLEILKMVHIACSFKLFPSRCSENILSFIKALTRDFLIGDHTSETPMFFF